MRYGITSNYKIKRSIMKEEKRPLIGISCNYDYQDIFAGSGETAGIGLMYHYLSDNYVREVEKAGGIPVMIPIYRDEESLRAALDSMDGLLLSGGNDMDPLIFGETDRGKCGRIIPERDAQDILIAKYAWETKKPLLCICRGIQVLNVALGGDLYQDLESDGPFTNHSKGNYPINSVAHYVTVEKDSLLHSITGADKLGVNSLHHQAVKTPAPGLRVTAKSEDGVIEALEGMDHDFCLALQWHPEKMYDKKEQNLIFRAFIEAGM